MNTHNLHTAGVSFDVKSDRSFVSQNTHKEIKPKKCRQHISVDILDDNIYVITKTDIHIYMCILKFFLMEKYNKRIEKECIEINKKINKDINIIVKQSKIDRTKFIYFLLNDYNYWLDNIIDNDNIDSYLFIFTYNMLTYYHEYVNLLKKVIK